MTMSLLQVCWALCAPALLGVLLLQAIGLRCRDDRLSFVAWVWPAGALAHAVVLFAYLWLSVEPDLWWTAPLLAALLVVLVRVSVGGRAAEAEVAARLPRRHRVFLGLGVLFCLLQFAAGTARPSVEGDEGNIWAMKAKSLIVDYYPPGGAATFAEAQQWNLHPDYPQLNPLLQAWMHATAGGVVQFENRLPVQFAALALWLALCAALYRRLPGWLAAGLSCVVLFSPEFQACCRTAYADALVALGLVLALDGWLRFRSEPSVKWAWLSAIGWTVALWSKNEAALYLACACLATGLAVVTRRDRCGRPTAATAAVALLPIGVLLGQWLFNRRFGLHNDLLGNNPFGKSMSQLFVEQWRDRAPVVAREALALVMTPGREFAVLAVVLLSPVLFWSTAVGRPLAVPTLALAGSFLGLHLVYVGSHLDLGHHLLTSQSRVVFQLVPVGLVWLAALLRANRACGSGLAPLAADHDDGQSRTIA